MDESAPPAAGGAEYITVPALTVDDARLARFAILVGTDPGRLLASWWRHAGPECAIALIHRSSGEVTALSSGRFCDWVIDGQIYPAVSIGEWFVHPGHEGKLLGRRLLRHFGTGRLAFGFSVSDRGIAYVQRLRWKGPYRAGLLAMPLPRVVSPWLRQRDCDELSFEEVTSAAARLPEALRNALDRIEARRRGSSFAHMRRDADTWAWYLALVPERIYRFCIAQRGGEPAGYVAVRLLAPGRNRQLGRIATALIADVAVVDDEPEVARALAVRGAALAAEMGAALALFLTTMAAQQRIFAGTGFLTPRTPLLGRLLTRRSPVFVWNPRPGGALIAPDRLAMTFVDGMLDLDL